MAQTIKNLPAMPETRVQSLGQEYPLKEEMATHSSVFAWRIPWNHKELDMTEWVSTNTVIRVVNRAGIRT